MTTKTLITRGGVLLVLVVALPLLSSCALNALIVRWPDGTNVLDNGSFEDGAFVPDQFGVMKVLPNDSTTIKNWTVVKRADPQDVAWYQNGNSFSIATTDGVRFLDLTGSAKVPHNGPFGGVTQKFSTIVGVEYHVSFYIGVWPTYDPGSN